MALIESEGSFKKRCDELHPEVHQKLVAEGIKNFSTLAFSLGSPQNPVSDTAVTDLATKLFGAASVGETALVRRLHFESATLLLADMKSQAASVDASEPIRKLPFIEKQARLDKQKKRIVGLLHKPDQQPSHALIDVVFNIVETGALTYVAPSKCLSRESEVQSEAKHRSKAIITLEQGSLKSTVSNPIEDVDTSTELKLFFAFERRHLAFEMMGLLSWSLCQTWLDKLMGSLLVEPPHHHNHLSLQQILKADREIFSILASELEGSLKAKVGCDPPLDEPFKRLMHDPRINIHLVPLPKAVKRAGDPPDPAAPKKKIKKAHGGDKSAPQMPAELQGLHVKNSQGKPMCWHFNLEKKCNNPVKSNRCRFGFHQCMKCLKQGHGAHECRSG